jgi:hypothetical protein
MAREAGSGAAVVFNDAERTQTLFRINIESAQIAAYAKQVGRRSVHHVD